MGQMGYRIGDYAVGIVEKLMKIGHFPFWIQPIFCSDVDLQRSGFDIYVKGKWKVEVKGDYACGEKSYGGTGNLFFQTHELNPLRRY